MHSPSKIVFLQMPLKFMLMKLSYLFFFISHGNVVDAMAVKNCKSISKQDVIYIPSLVVQEMSQYVYGWSKFLI